jgi:hypothetical protein
MPYAPFGFQTPIPPRGQQYWEPEQFGPLSPAEEAQRQALEMHYNRKNVDPAQLALSLGAPGLMAAFPRAAAAALGFAGPMIPGYAWGGPQNKPQEAQYKSQRTLRMEAEAAKEAAVAAKEKAAAERDALKLQGEKAAGERTAADAERERQRIADEEARRVSAANAASAKVAEEHGTQMLQSSYPSFAEEYGPAIATIGGLAVGKTMQSGMPFRKGGMQGKIRQAKEVEAERANALLPAAEAGGPSGFGAMNMFATEGGGRAPFSPVPGPPGTTAQSFRSSPDAPDFARLYQGRTTPQNVGPMAIGLGVGGIEGAAGQGLYSSASAERQAAEDDFARLRREGSGSKAEYTAAVQKLLAARQKEALGDSLRRLGGYTALGAGIGEAQGRLTKQPRPDVGRAEAAWSNLNRELNPAALAPAPPPPRARHPAGTRDKDGNAIGGRWQ